MSADKKWKLMSYDYWNVFSVKIVGYFLHPNHLSTPREILIDITLEKKNILIPKHTKYI